MWKKILNTIFAAKGNFSPAILPELKSEDGVEITPYKNNALAAVNITADFELNWAWRTLEEKERDAKGAQERLNIPLILEILEDHSIPITWATVGHLFLDKCQKGKNSIAHEDMPRPKGPFGWAGDWYMHDPCTSVAADPLWYCPDLIRLILGSRVGHEIGSHSFSHIDFSEAACSDELVERELHACSEAMEPFELSPKSLVFPYNKMGYTFMSTIGAAGITSVRHRDDTIRLSYPERTTGGVYKIYESMNLRRPKFYNYVDKAQLFINEAKKRYGVYHLWFHPSDSPTLFENEFRQILSYIDSERSEGDIWVASMKDIVAYCEARKQTSIAVKRDRNTIKIKLHSDFDSARYGDTQITFLISGCLTPPKVAYERHGSALVVEPEKVAFDIALERLTINVPATSREVILRFSE